MSPLDYAIQLQRVCPRYCPQVDPIFETRLAAYRLLRILHERLNAGIYPPEGENYIHLPFDPNETITTLYPLPEGWGDGYAVCIPGEAWSVDGPWEVPIISFNPPGTQDFLERRHTEWWLGLDLCSIMPDYPDTPAIIMDSEGNYTWI